ncbi:hypothetical protein LSH36_615g01009 [Paralvinella palmiformis]|uniref:Uncharacterized protein n=1 Tax=Paralvinella palmiformis TaxID=53620 RepID=A0AAD9J5C3_9ANNE|nr:hypothetical protein LSH36_615g01009 [Paralvinella palmiformis]
MLNHNYVSSIFAPGLMVPVLKKPTLDLGKPLNYRPITMSSTIAKLFKLLILPTDVPLCVSISSVSHGLCLLNDILCYSKNHHSNMFIGSMDSKNALIQFDMMACLMNYILPYLIDTGYSCIIGIPSLTLC